MELDPSKVCQVCYEEAPEGKSFQYHYGALCCLSCRAFFRRIVQLNGTEGIEDRYDCVSKVPGQKCNMKDFGYTHRCFKCRMERCLEVGIKPEKVLLNPTQRTKYTGMYCKYYVRCLRILSGKQNIQVHTYVLHYVPVAA